MSEVKRHTLSSGTMSVYGEYILSEDCDRLAAENERLREEHDKAWRHAGVAEENLNKAIAELEALRKQAGVNWQSFDDWLEWELDEGGGTKAQVSDAEKRLAKRVWHCLAARNHVSDTNVVEQQAEQKPVAYCLASSLLKLIAGKLDGVMMYADGRDSGARVALYTAQPSVSGLVEALPFVKCVIKKLERFDECAADDQDVDIGRNWLDLLTQLELLNRVQKSPARWEISDMGEAALAACRAKGS